MRIKIGPDGFYPTRATDGAAGYDLRADGDVVIPSNGQAFINTGVAVEIPQGHVGLVFTRSSLGKKYSVTLANSVGVIDSDYRGEISLAVANHGRQSFHVLRGDRIAQLLIVPVVTPELDVVDKLESTVRGAGGFGSTGVK